jgi:hypothetical protein
MLAAMNPLAELAARFSSFELRVGVAEARADVAEARADVAEARADAAEARADAAEAKVETLEKRVVELQPENGRLRNEKAELRAKVKKNSTNSHKPPSSDPPFKWPLPKKKGQRKPGGQWQVNKPRRQFPSS